MQKLIEPRALKNVRIARAPRARHVRALVENEHGQIELVNFNPFTKPTARPFQPAPELLSAVS